MSYELEKQVVKSFGLNNFRSGSHGSINPSTKKFDVAFEVEFLWAAEIYYFSRPLMVAVIQIGPLYKGFLFDTGEKVKHNGSVVNLKDWNDPVEVALHSVDVAPREYMGWRSQSLIILVATNIVQSRMSITLGSQNASAERIGQAVLEAISKIAGLYGSQDWQRLLKTSVDKE